MRSLSPRAEAERDRCPVVGCRQEGAAALRWACPPSTARAVRSKGCARLAPRSWNYRTLPSNGEKGHHGPELDDILPLWPSNLPSRASCWRPCRWSRNRENDRLRMLVISGAPTDPGWHHRPPQVARAPLGCLVTTPGQLFGCLRAVSRDRRRRAHPILDPPPSSRQRQGLFASRRDGLRPPLTAFLRPAISSAIGSAAKSGRRRSRCWPRCPSGTPRTRSTRKEPTPFGPNPFVPQ